MAINEQTQKDTAKAKSRTSGRNKQTQRDTAKAESRTFGRSKRAREEEEEELLAQEEILKNNPMMQPVNLMGQQAPVELLYPEQGMQFGGTGGSLFGAQPITGISDQSGVSQAQISPLALGMGIGNQPYVQNTDSGIQRGASSNLPGMDSMTELADYVSEETGVPMTGMRPINPETGQPASQMLIDSALRSGVELPQASVPMNAVQTPQPKATNQPSTYPLDVTVNGQSIPTTPQPAAGSPQAFFEQYREEGPLTEEQIALGESAAARMGTTFDPDTGFSRDNFLLGQQTQSMLQNPMGVDETRARLGGLTLNQYLNAPDSTEGVSGVRTDPQGRMIPSGFETRADAFGDYERESAAREGRLAARMQQPGESIAERDTRNAAARTTGPRTYGGYTTAQLRGMVGGGDALRAAQMRAEAGLNPLTGDREQTEGERAQSFEQGQLQNELLQARLDSFKQTEPGKLSIAESDADQLGLTGKDRQIFIIGKVAGPGVVDRILGKAPTSIIEAKEQRSQLAEARKLFTEGKTNEAADILASIGMINTLTGFPIMPSEYFKGVTPPPPPGDTGSEEPIEDVIARNL